MLEGLKEALQYVVGLGNSSEKVQVLEICGETYANRRLERYGAPKRAEAVEASTLSSMVEYILRCSEEFKGNNMIIQVESPKLVSLVSFLDGERKREYLFSSKAETIKTGTGLQSSDSQTGYSGFSDQNCTGTSGLPVTPGTGKI